MKKSVALRTSWRTVLVLIAVMCLLGSIIILSYPTAIACGAYVLSRWPRPYLTIALVIAAAGLGLLGVAVTVSPERVKLISERVLSVALGLGLTVVMLDVGLRLSEPPYIYPEPFYTGHERLGYFFAPMTQHRFWMPEFRLATFRTDKHGFIIRQESNEPQSDAHRILFLGDSFVEGTQVAPNENMSVVTVKYLEQLTSEEYQALNLGVAGYSIAQYLIAYEEFADDFAPETVVLVLYAGNDLADTMKLALNNQLILDGQNRVEGIRSMVDDGIIWTPNVGPAPRDDLRTTVVPREVWHKGAFRTFQWLSIRPVCERLEAAQANHELVIQITGDPAISYTAPCRVCAEWSDVPLSEHPYAVFKPEYDDMDQAAVELALRTLDQLVDQIRADDRRLVVLIVPLIHQVKGQGEELKPNIGLAPGEIVTSTGPQNILNDYCAAEGLTCLDLLPLFREHDDEPLYWPNEIHLTPRGHQLVGETIATLMVDNR